MADYAQIKINELVPYEKNARTHSEEQIQTIINSIQAFGFRNPVIIDENNMILAGHGRVMAAKQMGLESVPFIRWEDMSEDQKRGFILADNKTSDLAGWDLEILQEELQDLNFDMGDFGFSDIKIDDIEETPITEDEIPLQIESRCAFGDIWQLGQHRLICGDSTDADTISKLLSGATVDLLLTDPPYNVDLGSLKRPRSNKNNKAILNDSMPEDMFTGFLTMCLQNADKHMKPGAVFYIFCAGLHHSEFDAAVKKITDFKLSEQLIWVKNHFVLGKNSDYQWMHECCLYGWKEGANHYFTDSRKEETVIEDTNVRLSTLTKGELVELCEKLMGENQSGTVMRDDKPQTAEMHPSIKPQELLTRLIKNSSRKNETVLDLFGGSGSTMIACEQLNRVCYMCELDPHYCDVIIERYESFTGRQAVKVNE